MPKTSTKDTVIMKQSAGCLIDSHSRSYEQNIPRATVLLDTFVTSFPKENHKTILAISEVEGI